MVTVDEVRTAAELGECLRIRLEVFVDEQGVPLDEEIDDHDSSEHTIHLIATNEGEAIGTARVLPDEPGHCHIGRVALRKSARGTGAGKALMNKAAEVALEAAGISDAGVRKVRIELSAQEQAMPFYLACGYSEVGGESYLDAGIPHRDMALEIERVITS